MDQDSDGQRTGSEQAGSGTPGRMVNSGVYISGGDVSGPVAAGRGAQAVQFNAAGTETVRRIDQLLTELEAQARTLVPEQADDVADEAGRLRAEVHHRRPSAESIRLILGRLARAVAGTAALAANVEQISTLITQLVH
jgi:hypothetical protein